MQLVAAAIGFPVVFLVLAAGWGLLVDRLAGRCLHGALVVPVGYAAIVVASQLLTRRDGISDTTPYVLLALGLGGLALGWPRLMALRRRSREAAGPVLAFLGAYAVAIAPVLLAGRVTITAYLRDTTPGTHIAGAYGLIAHGASFASEPATTDGNQLRTYFDNAYPSGGHTALGGVGRLFETDLQWLFQPFIAVCLALGAPSLWLLARRVGLGKAMAVLAATVASVPALTYSYALQGSLKELALLPSLAVLPALLADRERWLARGWRGMLPFAVVGGAAIGAIGVAAAPWVAVAFVLGLSLVLLREHHADAFERGRTRAALRAAVGPIIALTVAFAVLIAPVLQNFAGSFRVANSFSQSNVVAASDPGNLLGPLQAVQALGVWITSDHRLAPGQHLEATYELIGIVLLGVLLGVVALWRRRAWTTLGWLAGSLVIWWLLTKKGTIWTDAKLLVIVGPTLVFVAFVGASGLRRASRLAAWMLAGAIALGVLWSDAVMYHETNLMPTSRYEEVIALDRQFAGKGPAWVPDFDEFLFNALRRTHFVSAGYAYDPGDANVDAYGQGVPYGASQNLDDAPLSVLQRHPLIIARNSPEQSRPPANYDLVHSGQWQVWERRGPAPLAHLGAHLDSDPTGVPRCQDVHAIARTAEAAGAELVVARRPTPFVRNLGQVANSPNWPLAPDFVTLAGPGRFSTEIRVSRAGLYRLWIRGDVARPLTVQVDGRTVGTVGYQSGGLGSYIMPVSARLLPGRHPVTMSRGGGSLHPGDGGVTNVKRLVVEPAARPIRLQSVAPRRWRSLCGERVDWIEAVPKG